MLGGGVGVIDILGVYKQRFKFWVAMVSVSIRGFRRSEKKGKKGEKEKIKRCGASFTWLGERLGDWKEGVWLDWRFEIGNLLYW